MQGSPSNKVSNLQYLFHLEREEILTQGKYGAHIREKTVVWMIELAQHLSLKPRTKHLAVKVLDVALRGIDLALEEFELLACLCLALAQKHEESNNLRYSDIENLTQGRFSRERMIQIEIQILKLVKWSFSFALPLDFLSLFSYMLLENENEISIQLNEKLDFCISESSFLAYKPSVLALACLLEVFIGYGFSDGIEAIYNLIADLNTELITPAEVNICCGLLQSFVGPCEVKAGPSMVKDPRVESECSTSYSSRECQ